MSSKIKFVEQANCSHSPKVSLSLLNFKVNFSPSCIEGLHCLKLELESEPKSQCEMKATHAQSQPISCIWFKPNRLAFRMCYMGVLLIKGRPVEPSLFRTKQTQRESPTSFFVSILTLSSFGRINQKH